MAETKEQFERRRFYEVCSSKLDIIRAYFDEIGNMESSDKEIFQDRMNYAKYAVVSLNRIITMHQLYTALPNKRYKPQMIRLNLSKFMASLVCYVGEIAKAETVELYSHFQENIEIITEPYLIAVILGQVLSNAYGCWDEEDSINFHMEKDEKNVRISITDVIGGVREDAAVFEAYFDRNGECYTPHLGLALSRRAAEFMGWTFEYVVKPSVGTTFILTLPLTETVGDSVDYESCLDGCKQILRNMMADMVVYPWLPGQPLK